MNGLEPFRERLDHIDEQIAQLLGERFDVCREVARYKREHDVPMMQPERVSQVRARYLRRGAEVNLPAEFVAELFEVLIAATCKLEDELMYAASSATKERDRHESRSHSSSRNGPPRHGSRS